MSADTLIELSAVGKRLPVPGRGEVDVLRDINLRIRDGEIVAILGRSGCGKSTLLRIICGLTLATEGRVLYRGDRVRRPVSEISMVFQTFALFPWLSTLENVELGLEAQGMPAAERRRRAIEAIDLIGLDGFESAYPKELSGGMRQRVGFARALVVNPDILLMDEAFSALDVPTAETLRDDLLDLWLERRIPIRAILMVSHSIEEVLMLADRVVILDSNPGRVKMELPVPFRHPRDPESPTFRRMMERIYEAMTATTTGPRRAAHIGYRLPSAGVAQMVGVLDEVDGGSGRRSGSLSELAEELQMEVDELFPILEALELLDFARVSGGEIQLTEHGVAFLDGDIQQRKVVFGRHLMRRIPLAGHIVRVLDSTPGSRVPESRFLEEIGAYLSDDEAERVLEVMIDWGRYAELFAYDYDSGVFSTENPGEEQEQTAVR